MYADATYDDATSPSSETATVCFYISPKVDRSASKTRLHIFFAADYPQAAMLRHGLRHAFRSSDRVLMVVRANTDAVGYRIPATSKPLKSYLKYFLEQLLLSPVLASVVLSGHSRGVISLGESICSNITWCDAADDDAPGPYDPTLVEAVNLFDQYVSSLSGKLTSLLSPGHRFALSQLRTYDVVNHWPRTGPIPFPVHGPGRRGFIDRDLVAFQSQIRALGYVRLIRDAQAMRVPLTSLSSSAKAQLDGVDALPTLGSFSALGASTSIADFCDKHRGQLEPILAHEGDEKTCPPGKCPDSLRTYVLDNNLYFTDSKWYTLQPWVFSHELFVAELVQEVAAL